MKNSNDHSTDFLSLAIRSELSSMEKVAKLYSLFLDSVNTISTVNEELQRHLKKGRVPLQLLKEQAMKIEKVIGKLGNFTLASEPSPDEIAILQEIKEKLSLSKPEDMNYLERRIHKLIIEISSLYKDKNLVSCLNSIKGKAWRLLEALIEYAEKEYDYALAL